MNVVLGIIREMRSGVDVHDWTCWGGNVEFMVVPCIYI